LAEPPLYTADVDGGEDPHLTALKKDVRALLLAEDSGYAILTSLGLITTELLTLLSLGLTITTTVNEDMGLGGRGFDCRPFSLTW